VNLLVPFGKLYGRVMDLRNLLYHREVLKSFHLPGTTYSVGNLTTGGTGKTPLVAYIAELLLGRGEKVCILTRGYGRKTRGRVVVSDGKNILADAETGGDEPIELARRLHARAVIIADADRLSAANWAYEQFRVTHFILDDGFQHRRVKRDVDIVCIDATNPCGNGRILPAGTLRESLKSLSRASAIVITRAELASDLDGLKSRLQARHPDAPIFSCYNGLRGISALDDFLSGDWSGVWSESSPERFFAFSGIGNPGSFFESLRRWKINVVGEKAFGDHHSYDKKSRDAIGNEASNCGAELLITTAKDAVKLADLGTPLPCFVALTNTVIDDEKSFRDLIVS
jgi:tetraacyldisaccharide 4'-kinase